MYLTYVWSVSCQDDEQYSDSFEEDTHDKVSQASPTRAQVTFGRLRNPFIARIVLGEIVKSGKMGNKWM